MNTTIENADTLVEKPGSPLSWCYVEPGISLTVGLMLRTYVSRTGASKVGVKHAEVGGRAFKI